MTTRPAGLKRNAVHEAVLCCCCSYLSIPAPPHLSQQPLSQNIQAVGDAQSYSFISQSRWLRLKSSENEKKGKNVQTDQQEAPSVTQHLPAKYLTMQDIIHTQKCVFMMAWVMFLQIKPFRGYKKREKCCENKKSFHFPEIVSHAWVTGVFSI